MTICNINQFLNLISKNQKVLMGIDLGVKRTGIAFSDPSRKFSLASKVINHVQKNFLNEINEIVVEYDVGGIVMGIPLQENIRQNKMSQSIKDKTKNLDFNLIKNNIDVPIIFWDESYTSVSAIEKVKNIFGTKKKQKKMIDKFAAMEILQDFLTYKSHLNEKKKK